VAWALEKLPCMRLIVREIKRKHEGSDHLEFDDFRDSVLGELAGEDFTPFWMKYSPPATESRRVIAAAPFWSETQSRHLLEMLSIMCVT